MKNLKVGIISFLIAFFLSSGIVIAHESSFHKITLCHATHSDKNPYVTITVDNQGQLNGHKHHDGDIIPAPEGGCPTGQEVTPTPTINPCDGECDITPTPTEIPLESNSGGAKGDDRGDYHQSAVQTPAAPTCNIVYQAPSVWYTKTNGKVDFHWSTDEKNIQKFSVVYGSNPDALIYGQDNISSDQRVLENVKGLSGTTYFQVWEWINDCATKSVIIDP